MKGRRIVFSKYRNPPIALPVSNKEVSADHHQGGKPIGGLWYALGSSWIEFIENIPHRIGMFVHEINVDYSKIFVINSKQSLSDFEKRYGRLREGVLINWPDVARDYSGVEVSGNGFMGMGWQEYWDVASGCIWGQGAIKDTRLLYLYDMKSKRFVKPSDSGVYAGWSSKAKSHLGD